MNSQCKPLLAMWEITRGCNLRCKHCFNTSGRPKADELTFDEAKNMIDSLSELGTQQFCITGGEPLTRTDLAEIIRYARSKGMNVGLISNGLLLTPTILRTLVAAGMTALGISIDGHREVHDMIRCRPGAFDGAIAAIRLAMTAPGLKVAAVTSVSKMNLDQLEKVKAALIEIGCPIWRIQMVQATGRMAERATSILSSEDYYSMIDRIIDMKTDTRLTIITTDEIGHYGTRGMRLRGDTPYFGDGSGTQQIAVGPSGEVKGAAEMTDDFVEGNIRVTPIAEIWNNPDAFAYNRKMEIDSINRWCRECRYLPLCRSGNPMAPHRYLANGDVKPLCTYLMEKEQGIESTELPVVTQLLEALATVQRT